ncbi:MAG: hypothetical protein E6K70_26685 [Planctomycetota bacterium]|nr:MAG: hypothetical protein E6K70_26685 [Planctomycetota bacterium]
MSSRDGQVEPLSCAELGRYRDAESALRDPQVQEQYEGQWVVAYQGQIIAHGDDPRTVLQEASRLVKEQDHRVVFCARDDPKNWFKDTSAVDAELANG